MFRKVILLCGALALPLGACATVKPQPLTSAQVAAQAQADRLIGAQAPPISAPLSLEEAIARALKYNLDQRVARAEQAMADRQLQVQTLDMLPSVMASAGYTARDEDLTRRSKDSITGGPSTSHPFISEDRAHNLDQLGVTWNVLDFGIGYLNAKQQGDRLLIAGERRRKAVHILIQDVQVAFWRAYAAQALRDRIVDGIKTGEAALEDSRKVERENLRPPLDSLRFQRQILENLRSLEALDQELSSAKLELARLINAPPSAEFSLKQPDTNFADDLLDVPAERLEELAIERNADLREQNYNVRIARTEAHKTMARLFPRLSFNYGFNYDSDSYLLHNSWNEVGAQLAGNLLNLATAPRQEALGKAGVALAEQRRVATLMALISQVHVSRLQYANARKQFARADELSAVEEKIAANMQGREEAQVQGKLETISATTSYVITMLRRYQALANVYAAESRIQSTLGLDPGLENVDRMSLPQLTQEVTRSLHAWRDQIAPKATRDAALTRAFRVAPAAVTAAAPQTTAHLALADTAPGVVSDAAPAVNITGSAPPAPVDPTPAPPAAAIAAPLPAPVAPRLRGPLDPPSWKARP